MTFKPSCPAQTGHLLVMNNIFRVGIIGAGHIAEKAQAFAAQFFRPFHTCKITEIICTFESA